MRLAALALLALLVLVQARLWSQETGLPELWRLDDEIAAQRAENAALAERNRDLEAEVEDLKHGLDAIEERARRELGMVRGDETFYQLVDR